MSKSNNSIHPLYRKAAVVSLFAVVVLGILTLATESKLQAQWQAQQFAAVAASFVTEPLQAERFAGISLQAQAAIVYDIERGHILYAKEIDQPLPLASVTKLFTAVVARRDLGAQSRISIPPAALLAEGESGLVVGDVWQVQGLIDYMLAVSSNDAAVALALRLGGVEIFTERLTTFARELGLHSIMLRNPTGLDENNETQAGAVGSAKEIAHLLAYITLTEPDILAATTLPEFTSVSLSGLRYPAINTNAVVTAIPNIIGGKTGYTDVAGGNLAVVLNQDIGGPIAIVVLGSTKEARFTDVLKLVDAVLY